MILEHHYYILYSRFTILYNDFIILEYCLSILDANFANKTLVSMSRMATIATPAGPRV
jgi:hypothetical protein